VTQKLLIPGREFLLYRPADLQLFAFPLPALLVTDNQSLP
jgi:hypothetical protein